jgi:hypothetical protein
MLSRGDSSSLLGIRDMRKGALPVCGRGLLTLMCTMLLLHLACVLG